MPAQKELLKSDAVLDVPREVQMCPYCGGELFVQFSCWAEANDGTWCADGVELDCKTGPDIGTDEWEEWWGSHSNMPYVYWLPATVAVEKWVNDNYYFDL